jgi:hypothetical protein
VTQRKCQGLLQWAATLSEVLLEGVRQIRSAGGELPDPNCSASQWYIVLAEPFSAKGIDPPGETLQIGICPLACEQFGRQHEPSDAEPDGPEELPARHVLVIRCHGGFVSVLDLG